MNALSKACFTLLVTTVHILMRESITRQPGPAANRAKLRLLLQLVVPPQRALSYGRELAGGDRRERFPRDLPIDDSVRLISSALVGRSLGQRFGMDPRSARD
jgi:hypothetical protein